MFRGGGLRPPQYLRNYNDEFRSLAAEAGDLRHGELYSRKVTFRICRWIVAAIAKLSLYSQYGKLLANILTFRAARLPNSMFWRIFATRYQSCPRRAVLRRLHLEWRITSARYGGINGRGHGITT